MQLIKSVRLLCLLLAVSAVAVVGTAQAADVTLKIAFLGSQDDEDYDGSLVFKDYVESRSNGAIAVNGSPLRFYHFTKLGPTGDTMTRRYARSNVEVYEIWSWYRREVARNAHAGVPKGWWHYGRFEDGTPIPKPARELWRDRTDVGDAFPRPRSTDFLNWLRAEAPGTLAARER